MFSNKGGVHIILIALLCIVIIGLFSWRLYRQKSQPRFTPIEGNPEIPAVSEEAERLDKMFQKLLGK